MVKDKITSTPLLQRGEHNWLLYVPAAVISTEAERNGEILQCTWDLSTSLHYARDDNANLYALVSSDSWNHESAYFLLIYNEAYLISQKINLIDIKNNTKNRPILLCASRLDISVMQIYQTLYQCKP